jgi:membrane associated rhomboid family serine protease
MNKKTDYSLWIFPLGFTLLLWVIFWGELIMPFELTHLGIYPRTIKGISGIFFSPLIHSPNDIKHIANNSITLFLALLGLIYFHKKNAYKVFVYSWIMTGILTWIIAKNEGSYHIGISSIIYSIVFYLFITGYRSKVKHLQALALLIVLLYGSLIWGIFPIEEHVSWQGHLSGVISGIILSYIFPANFSFSTINQIEDTKRIIYLDDYQSDQLNVIENYYKSNVNRSQEINVVYNYKYASKPKDEKTS